MKRSLAMVIVILLCAGFGAPLGNAQQQDPALVQMRADIGLMESILNEKLTQAFPGPYAYLSKVRGVYLRDYGAVFAFELVLTPAPYGPFGQKRPPDRERGDEASSIAKAREVVRAVLAGYGKDLTGLKSGESVVIVFYAFSAGNAGVKRETFVIRAQRDLLAGAKEKNNNEVLKGLEVTEY